MQVSIQDEDVRQAQEFRDSCAQLLDELGHVIVGQEQVIEEVLIAMRNQVKGTEGEGFQDTYVSESSDDGKHWSKPCRMGNTGEVHAYLTELDDGRILATYTNYHLPWGIYAVISEEWDRVLAVNLKGYFFFSKAVLKGMRRRKYGCIINIASEAAKNGGTICALHYAASKGAVLSFT